MVRFALVARRECLAAAPAFAQPIAGHRGGI